MERQQVMLQREALARASGQVERAGVFSFPGAPADRLGVREQVMLQRQQLLLAPACDAQDFLKLDGTEMDAYSPPEFTGPSPDGSSPSPLASSTNADSTDVLESRRQFHLACEQLRRRNIKDGLEDLKACLPQSDTLRLTKATVINKAVLLIHQLQRQKDAQAAEIARLRNELSYLRAHCTCGAAAVDAACFQHTSTPPPARKDDYTPIQPRIELAWRRPEQQQKQQQQSPPPPPPPSAWMPPKHPFAQADEQAWLEPFRRSARAAAPPPPPPSPPRPLALPEGWEMIPCPDGRTLYVNQALGESSWARPMLSAAKSRQHTPQPAAQAAADAPMPPGWDAGVTPSGLPFYIDHANRTTTVVDPRAESTIWTSGNIPDVQASSALLPATDGLSATEAKYEADEGYGASISSMDTEFMDEVPSYQELFPHLVM